MLIKKDTFNRILQMREKLTKSNKDILDCWKDYISTYPEIEEQCLDDALKYNFDEQLKPVILRALTNDFFKVEAAHDNFVKAIDNLNYNFKNIFKINDDIYIYFYIGLCNGAGWATSVNSCQAVLIGAEKVAELNWYDEKSMISLLYHELSHTAHSILRNETLDIDLGTNREKSIWQLYTEGFAQRYEQILYKQDVYHQDKNGWLNWCKKNHNVICTEYLNRINNNLSTQCFFGDWVSYKGHSDVGYYLGCEFIKYISSKYSTKALANLKICELDILLSHYLRKFSIN